MTKQARIQALNKQIARLDARLEALYHTSQRYTWVRIGVFLLGLAAAGVAWYLAGAWPAAISLAATGLLFALAVHVHRRVERGIERHRTWQRIKAAHIARARLDWERIPATFPHRRRPEHPFEADLDLVGRRSLHLLLDTAVSYEGSQRLRTWLTTPLPDRAQIEHRQQLVRELAPRSLFRDKLTLNATVAAGAYKTWEAENLLGWLARQSAGPALRSWLLLLAALAAVNAGLLVANRLGLLPPWWQITLVLYLGLMLVRSRDTAVAWDEALALEDALRQLRAVLHHLETFGYHGAPHLKALCQPFLDPAHRPSRYLAHTTRLVAAMGIRGNPLLWFLVNTVGPWDLYVAYRLDRHKANLAGHAPAWLEVWFELEALGSLANLAYLNPEYSFAQVLPEVPGEAPFVLRVQDLGHPLIPDGERVCNDLTIRKLGQVLVLTGSNMAGKSVFLKTVGLNLALAYAGGPVAARSLQTALFRLFTSMGIRDSVTDGISFFYAEVRRLKALLAELERQHPLPLLYAIDEIFRGTNNRERLIGSRAYVRTLAGQRGVGLIATHDLELTKLAGEVPQVVNYHFRDEVAGDRMVFDYTLRPGPCPTTNALKIMEVEGLPAPWGKE